MSFVDKDQLEPGSTVLLHNKQVRHARRTTPRRPWGIFRFVSDFTVIPSVLSPALCLSMCLCRSLPLQMSVVGLLGDDVDPMVNVMKVDKAPTESYADIGGLQKQIQEVKEAVELPMTHPELYEDIGIKPPKGVIFFGPPGTGEWKLHRRCARCPPLWLLLIVPVLTPRPSLSPLLFHVSPLCSGKTLLAKAVANETSATFLRVVGSELIQKYLGDGPKLVRELFRVADEHAPSIVFMDEIDAVGTKRYDSSSGGEREIQRTMLELLNQLDGFDARGEVKVIMATNRIETLDPALIRPGRIDRKIEFPLPDIATRRMVFRIHTQRMALTDDVDLEEFISSKDDLSGADIKAIWSATSTHTETLGQIARVRLRVNCLFPSSSLALSLSLSLHASTTVDVYFSPTTRRH